MEWMTSPATRLWIAGLGSHDSTLTLKGSTSIQNTLGGMYPGTRPSDCFRLPYRSASHARPLQTCRGQPTVSTWKCTLHQVQDSTDGSLSRFLVAARSTLLSFGVLVQYQRVFYRGSG